MIYFIGAGPGDPELITVKGARLLKEADVVIYTGSLVNPRVLDYCRQGVEIHNSATMTLEEVLEVMRGAARQNRTVARVHTGDPGLYGAIQEQMDALAAEGIPFQVIPGVSSFLAAAAAVPHELTLPGVTQTVILTRMEGRTAVPEKEKLSELARHRSTMCIFLSVQQIDRLVDELLEGGYSPDTPVLVVEKASWPEERIIRSDLKGIAHQVRQAGITRTALIMVGEVFAASYRPSRLYDPRFSHGYRKGEP
ncbi:precorrin-4 C(11)-methyltransferase [Desulfofundulus thermobenzoicus]|uniref:Precorrin-4 C(11)-methyltransferase n=1 Tax=Desulfofundulus thermobenzoicus TaxID=29376 RepID=A0A6N7IU38_9FIRM|nr:precorrin-4 C(11)-methyltransferase [Desulfofundulus thermobenzoicus]MQL53073.1 precorrin-4 C(11)-methyltransferase [Desulfofundulus thermobenzoicus]HHW43331.1 precorrin-4 C(11)-methyltransferase [Desulfotomaculum sp.]